MADPTETQVTSAQANALSGVTDTIGVIRPIENEQYYDKGQGERSIWERIMVLPNALRVVKDGDTTCGIFSGEFMDGGTVRTYAGAGTQALTNDDTNYVYLTSAGALVINVTGFPSAPHVPLATIAVGTDSAAAVTSKYDFVDIVDFRDRAVFGTIGTPGANQLVSQSLAFGDFTDNLDTTGFIDFTSGTIPVGSIITGWKAVVSTGFTNDTTAVIQVGIDGDEDAYSADVAQSVLAAGTVGSAPLAAEAFVGAEATPRVTVTGGSDFTSINAGIMVVTIAYVEIP